MKLWKYVFNRTVFVGIAAIIEVLLFLSLLVFVREKAAWIEGLLRVAGFGIAVWIIASSNHLSFDLKWILLVIFFPVGGTAVYILLGANIVTSPTTRAIVQSQQKLAQTLKQDEGIQAQIDQLPQRGIFHYLNQTAHFPTYLNRQFTYYPFGEKGYGVMLMDLAKAQHFIFLEYFIIEEGQMWNGILNILKEKAAQGVEVRVMYDDAGSFRTIPARYCKKLEAWGIQAISFNRINPFLSGIMNHRDHRKIMVIDGKVAFSGGVNLADEYINMKDRFGVWKDNMIRIEGEAVWTYTKLFLSHWNALRPTSIDDEVYHAPIDSRLLSDSDGLIVPYGDSPLDELHTGQDVYVNLLMEAKERVWIMTPYLIIDTELMNAMILASKKGVDVRVLTPGIPDKRFVWNITRSYYRQLLRGGVRIFEYSPGFLHAKVFLADTTFATVGTINLDYRSLYLHFENGTLLYQSKEIRKIAEDFEQTFEVSHEIKLHEFKQGLIHRAFFALLRIFASEM